MRSRKTGITVGAAAAVGLLAAMQLVAVHPSFAKSTAEPAAESAAATRVMALGDSITGSPGCWRALLWKRLQTSGYTTIDMVGTQPPQGCGFAYDGDHEGHGGALVTAVADQNQLPGWLSATRPDIVVMHFGTNDVWSNRTNDQILAAYGKLVDQMRASKATMRILVAKIIPVAPTSCPECPQRTIRLNNAIPGWAASKSSTRSPITVVDQWTGWNAAVDTSDGVHPNDSGNKKMSDRWYPPLAAAISGTAPSNPPNDPPSSQPSNPPSSQPSNPASDPPASAGGAASAGAGCTATYQISNQWSDGFQGTVTVTNTGTTAATGWSVTFSFVDGQSITQAWGARVAQSGVVVTMMNEAWNSSLKASGSTTAGFIASWSGSANAVPTLTCAVS